jgi:hypothetical protein
VRAPHPALRVTLALSVAALLWAGGCTLLTQFDENAQPCDSNAPPDQQCLQGFQCQAGLCTRELGDGGPIDLADAGAADAGHADAGHDAGH